MKRELAAIIERQINAWVTDFNHARPHSELGYLTPAAYAAVFTAPDDRLRNLDQLRQSPVAHIAPRTAGLQELHNRCEHRLRKLVTLQQMPEVR